MYSGSPSVDGGCITVNLVFHGNTSWWEAERVGRWRKGRRVMKYLTRMFGSMSGNATGGTLKGYWAAVGKNYPGKSGPVGAKVRGGVGGRERGREGGREGMADVACCPLHAALPVACLYRGTDSVFLRCCLPCVRLLCLTDSCQDAAL